MNASSSKPPGQRTASIPPNQQITRHKPASLVAPSIKPRRDGQTQEGTRVSERTKQCATVTRDMPQLVRGSGNKTIDGFMPQDLPHSQPATHRPPSCVLTRFSFKVEPSTSSIVRPKHSHDPSPAPETTTHPHAITSPLLKTNTLPSPLYNLELLVCNIHHSPPPRPNP